MSADAPLRSTTTPTRGTSKARKPATANASARKASKPRRAPRRDADPVRVYSDGRLYYWTGGKPGVGIRVPERCGTQERAEVRAEEIRVQLRRSAGGTVAPVDATMDDLCQDLLDTRRDLGLANGTTKQYKSEWNVWIGPVAGRIPCHQVSVMHFTAVMDAMVRESATPERLGNIARTVGAVLKHGYASGWFAEGQNAFGSTTERQSILQVKVKAAQRREDVNLLAVAVEQSGTGLTGTRTAPTAAAGEAKHAYRFCPSTSDVLVVAAAMELQYPGYGRRMVLVAFATGCRINEVLALRVEHINLDAGTVDVVQQLDRDNAWPEVIPPKGGRRTVEFWEWVRSTLEELIVAAKARNDRTRGWLFPPHRSTTAWADQAGKLFGAAKLSVGWGWSFHWLRHAHATVNLLPLVKGGYDKEPKYVQRQLGHKQLTTTLNMYVEETRRDAADHRRTTARMPGIVAT